MKYDPNEFKMYKSNVSIDEKIKNEIAKEIASTLGRYGNEIEIAVEKQNKILKELNFFVYINEKYEIEYDDIHSFEKTRQEEIINLIQKYNESYEIAQKYQYYLNIQKEALKLRGFDYDPYKIPLKIKIKRLENIKK